GSPFGQIRCCRGLTAFPGPFLKGRGYSGQQPLGVGGGTSLLTHAADEHVPGRAYERNRLPPLASSTLQHPLQAVGGQRPPAGDRKLSLAHAAPPGWRRTGGERSGRNSVTLCADSGTSAPLCSVFAGRGSSADPREMLFSSVFPRARGVPRIFEAQPGGLRFDEPPFDVWATNITPDRDSGIGNWSDAEIKTALQEGKRPAGHQLAE